MMSTVLLPVALKLFSADENVVWRAWCTPNERETGEARHRTRVDGLDVQDKPQKLGNVRAVDVGVSRTPGS